MNPREQELCDWILNEVFSSNPAPDLLAGQILDLAHGNPSIQVGVKNLETFQVQIGHGRTEYNQKDAAGYLAPVLYYIGQYLADPALFLEASEHQLGNVRLEDSAEPPEQEARGTFTIQNATRAVNVFVDMKNSQFDQYLILRQV